LDQCVPCDCIAWNKTRSSSTVHADLFTAGLRGEGE
jgi:hypothetical protein